MSCQKNIYNLHNTFAYVCSLINWFPDGTLRRSKGESFRESLELSQLSQIWASHPFQHHSTVQLGVLEGQSMVDVGAQSWGEWLWVNRLDCTRSCGKR